MHFKTQGTIDKDKIERFVDNMCYEVDTHKRIFRETKGGGSGDIGGLY